MPNYQVIPLTRGQEALVDAADYEWLMRWKWFAVYSKITRTFYAVRRDRVNGRRVIVAMHRAVLGLTAEDKRRGDHRNHDTLDNRRDNLRPASGIQSASNRRMRSDNRSGFKGVHAAGPGRFRATIVSNGTRIHLGYFDTAELAHAAYCAAGPVYHGEFFSAA
jgi:hypothetical protein